ncbi:efflux RND transporter periplasmic adaptor subunit [Acetobacter farinalis]|uniref:Efflux RND transporter periplasmic adaptor subunit n=1 Tax=Acetobacter farinalis TaxID=1260984 RepID=A0ABT3Q5V4_9PROT|nr:efflux RND transporter periplasmic adaptor subunit [Acetobacter farinalis]MCX2560670.1 efflux RND transporter periplasmic adaptor subunit [Acetobacter farinalis]NHO29190.1 efflux RND transporter periplasmic adaptor subunit [Acetobacter farinalis]
MHPLPFRPVLLSAVALLALSGCNRKAAPPAMPPQQVGFITLQPQSVNVHTSLPGRTDAYEIAQVRPQVTGVIQKRLFKEGADVQAGQQLYQIDPSRYQAAYDTARGQLAEAEAAEVTARAKLERFKPLMQAHAVSHQDYDDALAAEKEAQGRILNAKGQVESALVDLGYTHLNAPISGRIGRTIITVGALVTANQTNNIAIVTRLDPIYVDVNLPAITLLRLKRELAEGRITPQANGEVPVTLTLEDGSTYEHVGRMALSEVNVDPSTASVVVRAIMPNPDKLLLPGMFVHAQLDEGADPNGLLVPQQAVSRNTHGDPQVWIVKPDNTVELRQIQLGQAIGINWLVTGGLKAGERVVTVGLQKIKPGAKVKPTEDATSQADSNASSQNKGQ